MRLLVDENLGRRLVRLLQTLGHDATRVPLGLKNGAVMRLAIQERRVLVTRDADFADQARFPPARTPGIIHLEIHPPRFGRLAPALRSFLDSVSGGSLAGRLFVVGGDGYVEFR
jgi:hypothetical protein